MRYRPRASIAFAPRGTGHSPAAPAQRIRSPLITVTAFVTGARPVPSHRVAPTIAVEGLTGGGGTSLAWGAPQAAATRPASSGARGRAAILMATCSILPREPPADPWRRGLPGHNTRCERTGARSGDTEVVARRDPGHQSEMRQASCPPVAAMPLAP